MGQNSDAPKPSKELYREVGRYFFPGDKIGAVVANQLFKCFVDRGDHAEVKKVLREMGAGEYCIGKGCL